jgi:hypothetical protein
VDGALQATGNPEDASALHVASVEVGEQALPGGAVAGAVSFDDVRIREGALPASTLTACAPPAASYGQCYPVLVGLEDSMGQPAPAPYPFVASVSDVLSDAQLYMDPACQVVAPGAGFDAGDALVRLWVAATRDVGSLL